MSIRKVNKDHATKASAPVTTVTEALEISSNQAVADTPFSAGSERQEWDAIVNDQEIGDDSDDSLLFWTLHESPTLVDLRPFAHGGTSSYKKKTGPQRPMRARPILIGELASILRQLLEHYSKTTVNAYIATFRHWWRMFDDVERLSAVDGSPAMMVNTVLDINSLHRQKAFDKGMDNRTFADFVRVIDLWRIENGYPPLYWVAPDKKDPKRFLPPQWQIDEYRFALKHKWFAAIRRWEKSEQLLAGVPPSDENEAWLLDNYLWFKKAIQAANQARPGPSFLKTGGKKFKALELRVETMLEGFYPSAEDVRVAFHLCLASTGWNSSVLLALDINDDFLMPHPKDPKRYLLYGYKARGDMEVITEGLFRSEGSAGVIIQTLLRRTAALRAQVQAQLDESKLQYTAMREAHAREVELNDIRQQINSLEDAVRSPWLYVNLNSSDVRCLNSNNFGRNESSGRFLHSLADEINIHQAETKKIAYLKAGDFRDAFASYAYRSSGGFILAVMKVLQHKQMRSTQRYLDNTVMNEESAQQYSGFSNALFSEMISTGRVDPTIIAKLSRDHQITEADRARLDQYRNLQRSRIGVGCLDPKNPPKRIDPHFKPNGKRACTTQRCTLCFENAVILADSRPGLCKRFSEIKHIKATISVAAFETSSFPEELENTEAALGLFDANEVEADVAHWDAEIAADRHRVIDLVGI